MASDELSKEEIHEMLEWAVGAAGMACLLHFAAQPESTEEVAVKAEALEYGIEKMLDAMPDKLRAVGMKLAEECASEVAQEEIAVSEFMDEVERFL